MTISDIRTIWFDLDATLYSIESGLWAQIGYRIEEYMQNILGLPYDQMLEIKRSYYLQYGTTLRGLQIHNGVDTRRYLEYVHDIPVDRYIGPDAELRRMLLRLPQKRFVFTNSDLAHTERVLKTLGIEDCFAGFITVDRIDYLNKPSPEAYRAALAMSEERQFNRVLFLDDSTRNLEGAKQLGVHTVLVGSTAPHPSADASILRPHDLEFALPALFYSH